MKPERCGLTVRGIVQGVGFRPFIYNLAKSLELKGWVMNTGNGVVIEAEGSKQMLDRFVRLITEEAPPLSDIREIEVTSMGFKGYESFTIRESSGGSIRNTFISPDMSICSDCENELFDPQNRRYLYPYINCTNCGPRFTIIRDVPYDRSNTTMDVFNMCDPCHLEYTDPENRRYHAEPTSCEACGPGLRLLDSDGGLVSANEDSGDRSALGTGPVEMAARLLAEGRILAIKGLGGYHLACDAGNAAAVVRLRSRKHRDEKPFALMAKDIGTVRKYCIAADEEINLLASMKKPIVILQKNPDCGLPGEIAPGNPTLGVMLPYTPVHLLLFHAKIKGLEVCPEMLVMTSGNISSEPICYKDEEALEVLRDIADYYLIGDREIHMRTDDTVTRVFKGREYIIRRSRGYVPAPLIMDRSILKAADTGKSILPYTDEMVLACGGELKNTFCVTRDNEFYLSHHIGDLENLETMQSFESGIEHFCRLFDIKPGVVAYDLHSGYFSTQYALGLDIGKKIAVQHHHAHVASCMAENGLTGDVIGLAFDGTGYGEDGCIWGSEFFTGSYSGFKRAGHFEYMRMPGGDAAAREPWRMAVSLLSAAGVAIGDVSGRYAAGASKISEEVGCDKLNVISGMLKNGINSPFTSGLGRLFDGVSSLCGIRSCNSFEGQAAMELEFAAVKENRAYGRYCHYGSYGYRIAKDEGLYIIKLPEIVKGVLEDIINNVPAAVISSKFHETLAVIVDDMCRRLRNDTGLDRVTLSGGVFQNTLLLSRSMELLSKSGFKVFIHSRVPANDGGISLGQAVIAMAKSSAIC